MHKLRTTRRRGERRQPERASEQKSKLATKKKQKKSIESIWSNWKFVPSDVIVPRHLIYIYKCNIN